MGRAVFYMDKEYQDNPMIKVSVRAGPDEDQVQVIVMGECREIAPSVARQFAQGLMAAAQAAEDQRTIGEDDAWYGSGCEDCPHCVKSETEGAAS